MSHIQGTLMQEMGFQGLGQLFPCGSAAVPVGFLGSRRKWLVALPFWVLKDSGPLLTASLGGTPVETLCGG